MNNNNHSIIITGASTGIGRATAEYLAARGDKVYAGARKKQDLESLGMINNIVPIELDVTNQEHINSVFDKISKEDPTNTLSLVNNAGITVQGPLVLLDVKDLEQQLAINLFGVHRMIKSFFPLILQSTGRIVNISSVGGRVALPFLAPYNISKFSIEAYSDSLRRELLPYNIKVSIIEPGAVLTPIWDKPNLEDLRLKGSIFEERAKKFGNYFIGQGKKNGVMPEKVSKVIYHAIHSKKPKNRYLVAKNSLQTKILIRLPSNLIDYNFRKSLK